ncbi:HupE/UreJ family protein [Paenibacillus sp. LMG 31457]|uniref:HupE/UreJ family protein n=2 Tax=Paenibacillus planticolens TaxID=2654976 RepID=A0ABX1ZKK1_9BACL|nr:HupE/UreJ family protein [Paenibacillus planticolens]
MRTYETSMAFFVKNTYKLSYQMNVNVLSMKLVTWDKIAFLQKEKKLMHLLEYMRSKIFPRESILGGYEMSTKRILLIVFMFALFGLCTPVSLAHGNDSLAYSNISLENGKIKYVLQIDMYDLRVIATPNDPDIGISTPEALNRFVSNSKKEVETYLLSKIKLYADSLPLEGKMTGLRSIEMENEAQPFAEAVLEYPIGSIPEHFVLNYDLVFDNDQWHINYVTFSLGKMQQSAVIVNELREIQLGSMSFGHAVQVFFLLGLEHLMTGYVYILFLLGLLIGIGSVKQLLAVVAAFAAAHSLALILAGFHVVTPPVLFVKSIIALSILFVTWNNLFNRNKKYMIEFAIGFGLIYGFGSAELLSGMRADNGLNTSSLFAFAMGIITSLLLMVLVMYPAIHHIRRFKWAKRIRISH